MSVGWDVKWCPVSRITTPLARERPFHWVGSWGPPGKLQNFTNDYHLFGVTKTRNRKRNGKRNWKTKWKFRRKTKYKFRRYNCLQRKTIWNKTKPWFFNQILANKTLGPDSCSQSFSFKGFIRLEGSKFVIWEIQTTLMNLKKMWVN